MPSSRFPVPPVGEDFVAFLENTTQHLARHATEQPQHTTTRLEAHFAAVTELLENGRYTPALALRLHTLAAFLSQTTAWHHFDQGHHTHASQNWIAALHNAHAAGDHDMGAGLLGDLAYRAAGRGDHTTATNILNHALTRAQNPAARCLPNYASPAPSPHRAPGANGAPCCAPTPRRRNTSTTPAPTGPPGAPGYAKPISPWTPASPPRPRRHRPRPPADHRR